MTSITRTSPGSASLTTRCLTEPSRRFGRWLPVLASLAIGANAVAATFAPGNIVVLRVGDGTQTLANTGHSLFVDEFTTSGSLVQSIAVPDSGTNALIVSGTATSEGALMRSPDGMRLAFAGYNTNRPAPASLTTLTSAQVPRGVGTMDATGGYALGAVSTSQYSANNIRAGATDGANGFWGAGGNSGTYYFGSATAAATVQSSIANTRVVNIFNGNLCFSTASGSARGVYGFSTPGLPNGAAATNFLINAGGASSVYGFSFNPAGTIAYTADDNAPTSTGGIQRWTNSGTSWGMAYTVTTNAARGLVVDWSGANPILYATTATNSLIAVSDTGAGSAAALLVRGTTNTALRGVAFAPVVPPEVRIVVTNRVYAAYRRELSNGFVYVDADVAAGSPVRATQRALGYREVDYKSQVPATLFFSQVTPTTNAGVIFYDYSAQAAKTNQVGFWVDKDVPIIVGPDGHAYITDGHHTTAGYLATNVPVRQFVPGLNRVILGHIVANYYNPAAGPQPMTDAWWTPRAAENNAFLYGTNGNQLTLPTEADYANLQPILPSVLPMPNTPSTVGAGAMLHSRYRGLMWGLADGFLMSAVDNTGKKITGFKKTAPGSSADINFVEFYWADFLRDRIVWDDSKSGSPYGSTNGDASIIAAPLSFFAAVANGTALARSEAYRDQYGRKLIDYTNSALFTPNTVNWARGSLSNGFAKATDTYNIFLLDDSTVAGDITPSALSTNILHINSATGMTVTNAVLNLRRLLVNDGPSIVISWKDATVSNSTLRIPAGTGAVDFTGSAYVSSGTLISNGTLLVNGTLTNSTLGVNGGTLGGSGIVIGAVTVGSAGTLAPGASIGVLTINGALTLAGTTVIEISKSGAMPTNDRVTGLTGLTYGGVLTVLASGDALVLGDAFTLFDATTFSRAFAAYNLPALDAGLAWDTSRLLVDGTIAVGLAGATGPNLVGGPLSQTFNAGTTAALSGGALGSEPISYFWIFNGSTISGPTNNATLALPGVQEISQGFYQLVAQNSANSVTSTPALLTVNQTPIADPQTISTPWRSAIGITLAGSDPDGDSLIFTVVTQPTKGALSGTAPNLIYRPALGANGTDSVTFRVNDGRLDSPSVTVTINLQGWQNKGLVGVGRIAGDSFDVRGPGLDTLGGIGSAAFFDWSTWTRMGDDLSGYTYSGSLYCAPDRGFGDGAQNFLPRLQTLSLSVTPYYGSNSVPQNQVLMSNTAALFLTYGGTNYTGFDGDDLTVTAFPQSTSASLGQGRRSLDAEGLVRASDGGWYVCDEYGPSIYKFNASGDLEYSMQPPAAVIPRRGNFPGTNYFSATNAPTSGRRNNRGLEGISITPDGKRMFAVLQSPTIQDGGAGNFGRNTRVFVFDIDPVSPTFRLPIAEYAYQLTLNGNATTNRHTPISEILALNRNEFLVLERDGQGYGTGLPDAPTYKRIVLATTLGASNLINTAYDLERSAPGQLSFTSNSFPTTVATLSRFDLINMIDTNQLVKYGLNISTNQNTNTISEKWEALTLIPLADPAATNDFLLLTMNDNDFKAPIVYHNGVAVGTNAQVVDNIALVYRVTLPAYNTPAPANLVPSVAFNGPTNATLSAPADLTLAAGAYDQDGLVTKVEFYEGATKLGEDTTFPFWIPLVGVAAGSHQYTAVAYDNDGATGTSAIKTVIVTDTNILPFVTLTGPTNATLSAPARVVLTANANDIDGRVSLVQIFEGATKLAEAPGSPLVLTLSNVPAGTHLYQAIAVDNRGDTNLSSTMTVVVTETNIAPTVALAEPVSGATYLAPANFTITTTVSEVDGLLTNVTFYRNGARLGAVTASPWNLAVSNQPLGTLTYLAVAFDNQGAGTTSAPVSITVLKNVNTLPLALQILHASDLEAGVNAVFDAPAFSSVLGALKAQMPTNTVILSSGDNYIPGPFFNAAGDAAAGFNGVAGRADIAMLNAMGFQAAAFGNHEFDSGTPQVRSLILRDTAVAYQGTMFPYLSANLDFSTDSSMASLVTTDGKVATAATNQIARSCVINVAGQQIGLVGATTKDLRFISSPGTVGVNTNIAVAVQAAVDGLLAQGVNKVIVLAHLQQYANEIELAQQLRDVDVVIAGGSHAIFAKPTDYLRAGDVASTNYPVWLNTTLGEPVAVVNAGASYEYVGRLIVSFGTNGQISTFDPLSGVYATDEQGVANTGNYPTNATVLNIATNIGAIINTKDGNLFGSTTVYLNGLRQYGRTEEVNLGNLTANANLWRGQRADAATSISLKNGGGIRDSIGAVLGYGGGAAYVPPLGNPSVGKQFGQISQLDIENALRFNNGLALITLTAQQLRDAMEWGVAAVAPGATPGQFPQVGGMWFSYNPTNPPMTYTRSNTVVTGIATSGSRLQSLVARRGDGSLDLVVENGAIAGDPHRTFRMVTLGFLADGGDTYYPLTLATSRVNLAPTSGNTFPIDGGEQWALAAYMTNIQVYTQADTTAAQDTSIQSTAARTDTVTWPMLTRLVPGAGATVYFTTLPGKHYQVWAVQDLGGTWANLTPTTPIAGTGFLASFTDGATGPRKFYQIRRVD